MARHDRRWKEVEGEARSLAAIDDPAAALAAIDGFLREFPDTPRRADALKLAQVLKQELNARRFAQDRQFVDDLVRSESLPGAVAGRPDRARPPVPRRARRQPVAGRGPAPARRVPQAARRAGHRPARDYSRQYPSHFAARIERYQEYLKAHQSGGRFLSEAIEAKDRILGEWDVYAYRQAYDHLAAHPDDVAEVARRLREYLRDQPDGRFAADAKRYLEWWDKVSVPGQYKVTLRRGEVEPTRGQVLLGLRARPGRRRSRWPAPRTDPRRSSATRTGRSGTTRSPSRSPGSSATRSSIRLIDYDWSASDVYVLSSRQGDPLAIRLLSGTIKPAKGGKTTLVFASDFEMPHLTEPE